MPLIQNHQIQLEMQPEINGRMHDLSTQNERPKIGLLAGWGRYPIILAEKLTARGFDVHCLAIHNHADEQLKDICAGHKAVSYARVRPQIRYMQKNGITQATMAGKFFKARLFGKRVWRKNIPDWTFFKYFHRHFLFKSKDNNDDTLLTVAVRMFADHGINFAPATDFVPELLVNEGTLTRRKLSQVQISDVNFAWGLAKQMGKLDIGQSVIVKSRAILAVEAVEGTDECIRRAGQLCPSGGFTVVKVAKPHQDMRFDVPTIGVGTIKSMRDSGGKVLVVEADCTIILDQPELISLADELGIIVVATSDEAMTNLKNAAA